tara:strand:- start:307 stop:582 length:276 start_codon:yes stop_codon:yes gene_type:complete
MLQKIEKLEKVLDTLEKADKSTFLYKNFKEINSQLESILIDIKSNNLDNDKKVVPQEHLPAVKNLLNKIESLEGKILLKANLLTSFSNSNL